jgi:hypothetical protein
VGKRRERTTEDTKVEKEYLTGRVPKGFTDRFRASIPKGFQFGTALEVALSMWMSLPIEYRIAALTGQKMPSLPDLIGEMVDRKIDEGIRAGKLLSPPQKQMPSAKGPRDRGDADHPR